MIDSPTVLVHARDLRKNYGSGQGLVRALDAIDLDVDRGEAVVVMGPSGCGKSTLLHLTGGLDRPSSGELLVAGHLRKSLLVVTATRFSRIQPQRLVDVISRVGDVAPSDACCPIRGI
jgi:putative ABC transport system ATP-binding protein